MASLGMLNLLWVELLVRLLIKERIDLLGMQSLKYKGPIPVPSLRAGKGVSAVLGYTFELAIIF